jgi:hypothetical protein
LPTHLAKAQRKLHTFLANSFLNMQRSRHTEETEQKVVEKSNEQNSHTTK